MKQAGLEAPTVSMQNAEKPATERAAEECDIVIVGGGPAGLAAAISAKQTNADKNVILVEKLDILSGNGKFDMNFFDMINTEAQKAAGNDEWVGEAGLAKFIEEKSANGESAERIQVWANEEYGIDAWLRAMGVELNYNYGGTNHMAEDNQYSGEVIQAGLEKAAAELGVDVRTGTKGMDLVMEDGVCKGVVVTNNANETYTINAKSTIIATGGFCSNKELLAEYAPGYEVFNTSNQMGTTGDFVKVFEQNGFKMENMGKMSFFSNIIVPYRDLTGGADMNLLANNEGALLPNKSGMDRGTMIQEQPNGAAYYITDKTGYDSFYRIRKHDNRRFSRARNHALIAVIRFIHVIRTIKLECLKIEKLHKACPMMLPNDIQNDIRQTVYPPHFHTVLRVLCNDFRTRFGCKVIMGIITRLIFRKHLRIFQLADIVIICTCSCQSSICADFIRRRLCQICHNQAMMIRSRRFNHQPAEQLIIWICQLQ